MVLTNEELEANAPDKLVEAVLGWLRRHVPSQPWSPIRSDARDWYEWAAMNLVNDPEIRGAHRKEFGK
jgi:hypothetical protein